MAGGLISVAFLQGFLSSINVQRTLVCLDGGGGGSETDASLSWLVSSTADAEWRHQLGFLPAEEAVAERNRPSADETVMVFCRELFAWRGRSYPGWAFQRNFAWLVADGEGLDSDAEWSNQLRLDSRFFTYQYSADQSNDDRVVVNIREMYRVKRSPIITQDYGHWNHASGAMEVAEPALWERRTDLAGVELADTVLAWKPFMILDDPGGDFGMADGVMVEFLRSLQAVLNFTVRRYSPADGQWGFLEEVDNGTRKYMTGLVGELFRGEADLCTAGLYILKERQEYTDMLGVITDFSTLVLPRSLSNTGSQINMMAYLSIFSKGTWLCLLVSSVSVSLFFLLSGVVFFFHLSKQWPREKMKMKGLDESWWRKKVAFAFMSEGVEVAFLTLVQRGVDISVNLLSTRVAFLTANMVAFIMFAYYDADLTAKMTHRSPTVNLRSFQDVLDAEYRVRIIKGSAFVTWFKESPKGSAMHKVYEQMVEDPSMFVDNYAQAEEILKATEDAVGFDSYLYYIDKTYVTPIKHFEERVPAHVGWALQPNSELTDIFSYHLTKMKQSGLISRIMDDWLKTMPENLEHRIFIEDASPLGYLNLFFPSCVFLVGFGLATGVFCLEQCVRLKKKLGRDVLEGFQETKIYDIRETGNHSRKSDKTFQETYDYNVRF